MVRGSILGGEEDSTCQICLLDHFRSIYFSSLANKWTSFSIFLYDFMFTLLNDKHLSFIISILL